VLSFKKKAGVRLGLRVTLGYWLIEDEVGFDNYVSEGNTVFDFFVCHRRPQYLFLWQ
jgi:hypothetical protein